jgi:N-acetylneuraminic acid mutarotase
MNIPFLPKIPKLPPKEEWEGMVKKQLDKAKQSVCITLITKNPKNIDINEYIESYKKPKAEWKDQNITEWKFPCYNAEARHSGDTWVISVYFHIVTGSVQNLYYGLRVDPVTKRQFPDRQISFEILEVKKDAKA